MPELTIGNLTFRIEHRRTDDDRGPAIRVFGGPPSGRCPDGREVQLLRFDCFESDPHYHYDPTGKNVMFHLDPLTMGDPVEFSLQQIATAAQAMIEKAGFPQTAAAVDPDEIAERIDELRQAVFSERE